MIDQIAAIVFDYNHLGYKFAGLQAKALLPNHGDGKPAQADAYIAAIACMHTLSVAAVMSAHLKPRAWKLSIRGGGGWNKVAARRRLPPPLQYAHSSVLDKTQFVRL